MQPSILMRLVYALCLAGATCNHAAIVFEHGLHWDYDGLPVFVTCFWTALTFVDPLAIILLLTKPKPGQARPGADGGGYRQRCRRQFLRCLTYGFHIPAFATQALFLLFVLLTVRIAWRADGKAGVLTASTHFT